MSYSDRIHSTSRPTCWGNVHSYDQNDIECADCRFRHSCNVEVNRETGTRVNINPNYNKTNYRSRQSVPATDEDAGVNKPAVIEQGERPIDRFTKDAIGGGLRGMFYEMWQFWRHYRIR